jgi:hypothetical protein
LVKLSNILRALPVIDENVWAESARQPLLFKDAARYRVSKMRVRSAAKSEMEAFAAQYGLRLRSRLKVTEGHIKAKVETHPKYRRLRAAYEEAEAREEFSKLVLEAYRQRRDAIQIIAKHEDIEGNKETAEIERLEQRRNLSLRARSLQSKFNRGE